VSSVLEALDIGMGSTLYEISKEAIMKDRIFAAPEQKDRTAEFGKDVGATPQCIVGMVLRFHRDIEHKVPDCRPAIS
jgi:hypothetical protein